ncbi:retrovirus-related pol polyprotein from transposon TNT 1-94 [Tanacetum coccineum]|uniref:Retrovirus-related pol polyprotein from transposon TNT 1-94 n=1 Tax=Tanacetum coccineum TaxID=301880 RepID=A0ABQ5EFX7_9ASTR
MGTFRFGNDHFAAITGYGDYVQENLTICHVYYVEGLGHNLFSVGQFYDGDLEVAFRSNTCYVRNFEGDDLLTGSRESNLYTISIFELTDFSFEFWKKKESFTSTKIGSKHRIQTRMNSYGFVWANEASEYQCKKYIIVIIDDYYRYTWVYSFRTKDEAPDMIINFINQVQRSLKAQILKIRTDNGTEFKNEKLWSFYAKLGIVYHTLIARTPQQNGPSLNYSNFHDSSDDMNEIPSQQDLDHLFGPLYEEYYVSRTSDMTNDSAANTLDVEDTPSPSLIIVEDGDTLQIVTSLEEPIIQESSIPVLETHSDEQLQEDIAELDGNTIMHSFENPEVKEAESSSNYQDPSNMHEFHQQHHHNDKWTKNHPTEQVIGDPSKPVQTRNRLRTDVELCMYALIVSLTEPKNIMEAMIDHSWIESIQDEPNQFKHLDV